MWTLRRLRRLAGPTATSATRAAHARDQCAPLVAFASRVSSGQPPAPARWLHSSSTRAIATDVGAAAAKPTKRALSAKQKKQQMQWNVHREITVLGTPLPAVFARLRDEVAARGASIRVRQAIDVFYFNCAQQVAALDAQFVAEVVAYFEDELLAPAKQRAATTPLGESLNEGVFTSVVRLLLAQGHKQRAWEVAQEPAALTNGKLHFRSVGPILDQESRDGEFPSALARWRQLKLHEMEWTTAMEDTLVQMVIACQRHYATTDESAAAQPDGEPDMRELLRDLSLATREVSPDNASRLRHAFQACGFAAKVLPDNQSVTPQCGACRAKLTKDGVTDAERAKLLRFIEHNVPLKIKNASATTKEFLVPFKRWLTAKHAKAQRYGKLHFVLDGPNIAYLNQNFDNGSFRFDHVDHVVQMLQREGHEVSITIPHSYLEETSRLYIRTKKAKEMRRRGKVATRQRTPADKATIERWRDNNLLFSCRTDYLSDDIFWLYASALLGEEARVVTNDQGRDHVFTLLNNRTSGMTTADLRDEHRISMDLLDRWRESAIVNIEIQHGELPPDQRLALETRGADSGVVIPIDNVRLVHPAPFSRVPQLSASGHFHFPIADVKGEGATKWLCLHRPSESTDEHQDTN